EALGRPPRGRAGELVEAAPREGQGHACLRGGAAGEEPGQPVLAAGGVAGRPVPGLAGDGEVAVCDARAAGGGAPGQGVVEPERVDRLGEGGHRREQDQRRGEEKKRLDKGPSTRRESHDVISESDVSKASQFSGEVARPDPRTRSGGSKMSAQAWLS